MTDINLLEMPGQEGDLLIGCIGYEKRSRHFILDSKLSSAKERLFFDYQSVGLLSYDENLHLVSNLADLRTNFDDYLSAIRHFLQQAQKRTHIKLDVTSFDRVKTAKLISLFFELKDHISALTFLYAPSKFQEPKLGFGLAKSFGPVIPELMGDSSFEKEEMALIVGAGYEFGRVVGAIDTLEPRKVICFRPTGTDPRYDNEIMRANLDFNFLEDRDALLPFDVRDSFALYYNLRRVIEQENASFKVMILPLGPKIFAAISMLIAIILHPKIMVWRHSTVDTSRPESVADAEASATEVEFSFEFLN